jgi:hypothetical protein
MPFLKMFSLMFVIGALHEQAGGHWYLLWLPYALGMTIAIYVGFYLSMIGAQRPRNVDPTLLWEVGKASLWPAAVMPLLMALIQAAGYLDNAEIFPNMIIAALAAPIYSIFIFGAFFRPPSAKLAKSAGRAA